MAFLGLGELVWRLPVPDGIGTCHGFSSFAAFIPLWAALLYVVSGGQWVVIPPVDPSPTDPGPGWRATDYPHFPLGIVSLGQQQGSRATPLEDWMRTKQWVGLHWMKRWPNSVWEGSVANCPSHLIAMKGMPWQFMGRACRERRLPLMSSYACHSHQRKYEKQRLYLLWSSLQWVPLNVWLSVGVGECMVLKREQFNSRPDLIYTVLINRWCIICRIWHVILPLAPNWSSKSQKASGENR